MCVCVCVWCKSSLQKILPAREAPWLVFPRVVAAAVVIFLPRYASRQNDVSVRANPPAPPPPPLAPKLMADTTLTWAHLVRPQGRGREISAAGDLVRWHFFRSRCGKTRAKIHADGRWRRGPALPATTTTRTRTTGGCCSSPDAMKDATFD